MDFCPGLLAATVPSQIMGISGTAAVNGPGATATITFSLTGLSAAPVVGIGGVDFHGSEPGCDLVHAHLHRVEGDLSNAGYWYSRAGRPAATGTLDDEWNAVVGELLR